MNGSPRRRSPSGDLRASASESDNAQRGQRGARRGRRERTVVPDVEFTSYYGRPVVKSAPWASDIPGYLFLGGLAAGSSLLAAGADLTGRDSCAARPESLPRHAIVASFAALVLRLRPTRAVRQHVARRQADIPMSVGVWLLTGYGPLAGVAAISELPRVGPAWADRLVRRAARPAGLAAAVVAPAVASYTAVLLSDTATPPGTKATASLPFVFVGSAAASSGGAGLICAHRADAGPARRMAVGGAIVDVVTLYAMEQSLGLAAEPLRTGALPVPGCARERFLLESAEWARRSAVAVAHCRLRRARPSSADRSAHDSASSTPENSPPMTRSTRSRRSGTGSGRPRRQPTG